MRPSSETCSAARGMSVGSRVTPERQAPIWFSKRSRDNPEPLYVTVVVPGGTCEMTSAKVMGLLRAQVPLTLLYDLMEPSGPASAEIMDVEAGRLDPYWPRVRDEVLV